MVFGIIKIFLILFLFSPLPVFLYISCRLFLVLLFPVSLFVLSLIFDWFIYKFRLSPLSARSCTPLSPGSKVPPRPVTWQYYCSVKYGYILHETDRRFRYYDSLVVHKALNVVFNLLFCFSCMYWYLIFPLFYRL